MEGMTITLPFDLRLPQLEALGAHLAALEETIRALGDTMTDRMADIHAALDSLNTKLDAEAVEITAIADELRRLQAGSVTDAEIAAVVTRVEALGERIGGLAEPMAPAPPV